MNDASDRAFGVLVLAAILGAIAWQESHEPRLLRYISSARAIAKLRAKGYRVRRTRTATGQRAILRSPVPRARVF